MSARAKRTNPRDERTVAEWVTFGVACAVLAVFVGLILSQITQDPKPAAPVATQSGPIEQKNGKFFVPVEVVNRGDETAENVQVAAELTIDGETATGDQTITFLAGREVVDLVFSFDDDPGEGDLVVRATGFANP